MRLFIADHSIQRDTKTKEEQQTYPLKFENDNQINVAFFANNRPVSYFVYYVLNYHHNTILGVLV